MNTTVKNLFQRFCEVYNLKTSATIKRQNPAQKEYYSNEFIKMDYNPHYGGYRMDIVEVGTSERFFSDMGRRSAKEMIAYLQGLLIAKSEYNFRGIINAPTKKREKASMYDNYNDR